MSEGALMVLTLLATVSGFCGGVAWQCFRSAADMEALRKQLRQP